MAVKESVVKVRRTPRISEEEYREKLGLKRLDIFGAELPDPTVMEPPVNFVKQPSIFEHQRELVRQELDRRAQEQGFETAEEAENFQIFEDELPSSRHQYTEMEEETINKYVDAFNSEIAKAKAAKAAKAAAPSPAPSPGGQGPAEPAREALDAQDGAGTPS